MRDISQNITSHFKSQQKDTFCQAIYIKLKYSNEKMTIIKIVEDILRFPKSPRSPLYDKNCESYDWCKLGNFEKMHETQIDQT